MLGMLFISLMFSCSSNNDPHQKNPTETQFLLTGQIENIPEGGTIQLLTIGENRYIPIDSVKSAQGKFRMIGTPNPEQLYVLDLAGQMRVPIFLNKGEINILVDASDPRNEAKITGSPYSAQLEAFNNLTRRLEAVLYKMETQYTELARAGKEKEMNENGKEIEKTAQSQLAYYKSFIDSIGVTPVTGLVLGVFNPENDFEYMDSMLTVLKTKMPTADYVIRLEGQLAKFRNLRQGQIAPDIQLENPKGEMFSLSELKGKWVLVDFWASWCKPCRAESPNMVKLYNTYKSKPFEILGVSLDSRKQDWIMAISKDNYSWPQISDLKGWQSAAAKTYQVTGIPFTVLVNPEGKIHAKGLRGEQLEKTLAALLK